MDAVEVDGVVRRLLAAREAAGMSQREVASRAGIGHGHLSRIETGQVDPKLSTLQRIATVLGVEL